MRKTRGARAVALLRSAIGFLGLPLLSWGCAYRCQVSPLEPATEQSADMRVADDGTVTYVYERFEVALRPMTDEELNREFASGSQAGRESLNPYTYGNWVPRGESSPPPRFTVFRLSVKNYAYPKVQLRPNEMALTSRNGRIFLPLTFEFLREYYAPYNVGWIGVGSRNFEERKDLLKRTLFPEQEYVFSGQERMGYVVFPTLPDDVVAIEVLINDLGVRYDVRGKAVEALNLNYRFSREVTRRTGGNRSGLASPEPTPQVR